MVFKLRIILVLMYICMTAIPIAAYRVIVYTIYSVYYAHTVV